MKRYNFNLVEIMLAVVILTLGMTSVFVLFPAGLSNHRTAMAENTVADIAELVFSRIRAESALAVDENGFKKSFPTRDDLKNDIEKDDWQESLETFTTVKDGLYLVRHVSGQRYSAVCRFCSGSSSV